MSGPLLVYPLKPHEVADDNESFIHVLEYCALRFHRHTMTNRDTWGDDEGQGSNNPSLAIYVHTFFSESFMDRGYLIGGRGKFQEYFYPQASWELLQYRDYWPFKDVLTQLHTLCHQHYLFLDRDALFLYRPLIKLADLNRPKSPSGTVTWPSDDVQKLCLRFLQTNPEICDTSFTSEEQG